MSDEEQITLQLYTRPGCHLCEQLRLELEPWQKTYNLSIDLIDISDDDELIAHYAGRIPVLAAKNHVICEYFLDENQLKTYLENNQNIN